ncbi:methyltransferase domain-containing protein [Nonomuraea endophytica]|uniref:methyltransferase domain-containing protein n=1 Tax=Nonomuraea endophytica TaxID=714136 RepID=UPI0037CB5C7B
MIELARQNAAGATNVEFLLGTIEAIPLPGQSVHVVISNCVINLSSDASDLGESSFFALNGGSFAVIEPVYMHQRGPCCGRAPVPSRVGGS